MLGRHYADRLGRTENPANLRSSRNLELYQIVVEKLPNQDELQLESVNCHAYHIIQHAFTERDAVGIDLSHSAANHIS